MSWKWHPKPSTSDFCSFCDCFEVSQKDQFATILCSSPKMALSGPKRTQNGLKWPEPIEIAIWNHLQWISASLAVILSGHMTSLRQFWIWGQNWPKMAEKGPKWPKMAWMSEKWHPKPSPLDFCFSCGHFEWSHDQFTTILSVRPKLAKNGRKVPQMTEIGLKSVIRNHLDWISASLAVILSGHMITLQQFWIWGQNWP